MHRKRSASRRKNLVLSMTTTDKTQRFSHRFELKVTSRLLPSWLNRLSSRERGSPAASIVPAEVGRQKWTLLKSPLEPSSILRNVAAGGAVLLWRWQSRMGERCLCELPAAPSKSTEGAGLQFDLVKANHYGGPTFENETEAIMDAGIYRPVDDAVRIAFTELVGLDSYRIRPLGSRCLRTASTVGKPLARDVDPKYVRGASVATKLFDPEKVTTL